MTIPFEKIKKLPDKPGVYFFKKGKEILYIGKATSLRDRVRSYFKDDLSQTRGPLIEKMIAEADDVEVETTDSVLEALILEANLIKKHQPPYNSREKDNKSFNYVIFINEAYPRVYTVRGRELETVIDPDDIKYTFGPYPHGLELREALKIIRRIFPFRGKKDPVKPKRRHSVLPRQIGIVPDLEHMSVREYSNTIQNLRLFFEGKKGKLVKKLTREMKAAAKEEQFEQATKLKKQIFAIEHINDVSLIKEERRSAKEGKDMRIEAYDIAHTSGSEMVGVMVVLENGFAKKSEYRKFKIKEVDTPNDTAALKEVLERRFAHDEWRYPRLVVLDGGKAQLNAGKRVFEKLGLEIPLVSVVKGEKHQAREILGHEEYRKLYESEIAVANSEAHRFALAYHKERRRKM